jgi:hypothetical protein
MPQETFIDSSGAERELMSYKILENPITVIDQDTVLKVFAVRPHPTEENTDIPVGFVSTKSTRVRMLGEFSGEPTGEYAPCNTVKGFVGEGAVYEKTVTTDTALSGFRTAIAQKRAARAVKSRLS